MTHSSYTLCNVPKCPNKTWGHEPGHPHLNLAVALPDVVVKALKQPVSIMEKAGQEIWAAKERELMAEVIAGSKVGDVMDEEDSFYEIEADENDPEWMWYTVNVTVVSEEGGTMDLSDTFRVHIETQYFDGISEWLDDRITDTPFGFNNVRQNVLAIAELLSDAEGANVDLDVFEDKLLAAFASQMGGQTEGKPVIGWEVLERARIYREHPEIELLAKAADMIEKGRGKEVQKQLLSTSMVRDPKIRDSWALFADTTILPDGYTRTMNEDTGRYELVYSGKDVGKRHVANTVNRFLR